MKTVCIPLANGFEEIEAVSLIDVLRRADVNVITIGVSGKIIEGGHNIKMETDMSVDDVSSDKIDMILLPGGLGGTHALMKDGRIQKLIKEMDAKNKLIGAICAAPMALDTAGVLKNKFTCYPGIEGNIKSKGHTNDQKVVVDGNIMTSQGPATAMIFALEIVKKLCGEEKYNELSSALLMG